MVATFKTADVKNIVEITEDVLGQHLEMVKTFNGIKGLEKHVLRKKIFVFDETDKVEIKDLFVQKIAPFLKQLSKGFDDLKKFKNTATDTKVALKHAKEMASARVRIVNNLPSYALGINEFHNEIEKVEKRHQKVGNGTEEGKAHKLVNEIEDVQKQLKKIAKFLEISVTT